MSFLSSLVWKQSCKSEKERFDNPYKLKIGGHELVIEQGRAGLGCTVWDGAIVLSKFFETSPLFVDGEGKAHEHWKGKRVIELGAGTGLAGLALTHLGAKEAAFTDQHMVIECLERNVEKNRGVGCATVVEELDWGQKLHKNSKLCPPYDVVVGAEIMYLPETIPKLLQTIEQLSHSSSEIYMSYGVNRRAAEDFKVKATASFEVEEVDMTLHDKKYRAEDVSILSLKPKKQP